MYNQCIRPVKWREVRDVVESLNPELASRLDALADQYGRHGQGTGLMLWRGTYGFGSMIVEGGKFRAPCQANDRACIHCHEALTSLQLGTLPVALVESNSVEVFVSNVMDPRQVVSKRVIEAGELFGVFEALDALEQPAKVEVASWSVSAGARSALLIKPKISYEQFQAKLNVGFPTRRWSQIEQSDWELIKEIMAQVESTWKVDILLIPSDLYSGESPEALKLRHLLYAIGWSQSRSIRRALAIELGLREACFRSSENQSVRRQSRIVIPVLAQLINIASGDAPALVPIGSVPHRPSVGPFDTCLELLRGLFLKDRKSPVMLEPRHLRMEHASGFFSILSHPLVDPDDIKSFKKDILERFESVLGELEALISNGVVGGDLLSPLSLRDTILYGRGLKPHEATKSWLRDSSSLTAVDLLPPSLVSPDFTLHTRHPFFTACAKVVRK